MRCAALRQSGASGVLALGVCNFRVQSNGEVVSDMAAQTEADRFAGEGRDRCEYTRFEIWRV